MEIFSMILSLLSGVALFLFGMSLMGDGLEMVAGNKLEAFLYRMTNTPLKGVALGTAVTSVIQSSSATTVMVIGFVNSGMMKLKQAIGIIMGANIGTSITGWILCLSYIEGREQQRHGLVVVVDSREILFGELRRIGHPVSQGDEAAPPPLAGKRLYGLFERGLRCGRRQAGGEQEERKQAFFHSGRDLESKVRKVRR